MHRPASPPSSTCMTAPPTAPMLTRSPLPRRATMAACLAAHRASWRSTALIVSDPNPTGFAFSSDNLYLAAGYGRVYTRSLIRTNL